jgi:multidrug efflux pump subunit AcrA (membrane-fusion protein)
MAENEKILPIKEREDGTVVAAIEPDDNHLLDEHDEPKAEEHDDRTEEEREDDEVAEDESEDEEEREKIREARREERRLKKELRKQRDDSSRNKITALERRNEELARRLAEVENTSASYKFAQVDKALEDEQTRVEYAKMKLLQASQAQDGVAQAEYLEQLQDAKLRLAQVQAYKKQQLEEARQPKQNVPNPVANEVRRNADGWLQKNKWFDPNAKDTDSKIAKVIDQELAADGWDPADPEYWEELDSRLQSRLPHRYSSKGERKTRNTGPTASSRTTNPSSKNANTITLSKERVEAIKEAGAWDDPARRAKMIRAYAQFDKQNRNG